MRGGKLLDDLVLDAADDGRMASLRWLIEALPSRSTLWAASIAAQEWAPTEVASRSGPSSTASRRRFDTSDAVMSSLR
jgi:hypothetical protein